MKRYLPDATQPWAKRIRRVHTPKGSYKKFKPCLSWEFGFSCSFCLLHEVDLMIAGTHGWSLMQAEHAIPQSKSRARRNQYTICFYICERCNKARGNKANSEDGGRRLLNPCADRWSDHFVRVGDELQPRDGDKSAQYTWESYDLDDPCKVTLRNRRRHWIENSADALVDLTDLEIDLQYQLFENPDGSDEERLKAAKQAQKLHGLRIRFIEKLDEYKPVPPDADVSCSCGKKPLAIPQVLEDQTVELEDFLRQARERREDR